MRTAKIGPDLRLRICTISTQSSSAHIKERDQERIPKPVSTGVKNGICTLIDHGQRPITARVAFTSLYKCS